MTSQGQGPLNDPRLVERRGDLSGLNAALFVILVIAAFAAAGYLLWTVLQPGSAQPSASPSHPVASPSAATPKPTGSPVASAKPTPGVSQLPSVAIGQAADVTSAGRIVGSVTVVHVTNPDRINGQAAGLAQRWLVARVRYAAMETLSFSAADWFVADQAGTRYPWAGSGIRQGLGSGTVQAGGRKAGDVIFRVPLQGSLRLVLTSGGADQLTVPIP
ncbi:MAG: hypothetical protein QOH61_1534 [Chloroflexota bacterium]|nr:hypothetical protein [Chloroflexota bacterium]